MTPLIDRLLQHDRWATRRLIETCRPLTPEQLHQPLPIGPGGVHATLVHIIGAMSRWARRLQDQPAPVAEDDTQVTLEQMLEQLDAAAAELEDAVVKILDGRTEEQMEFAIPGVAEPFRFTRGTAVIHILTHGTHHRAQILNMLRQLGVDDLPDLDAIEWESEGQARR